MDAKVLKLKKKTWSSVINSKGEKIPGFLRNSATGKIFVRRTFKKLRLPPLFQTTNETTVGRAKTVSDVLIQKHKNYYMGISDGHVFGNRTTILVSHVIDQLLEKWTPERRLTTQTKHRIYLEKIRKEFGSRDISSLSSSDFENWIDYEKRLGKRKTFLDYAKHANLLMRFAYGKKYLRHQIKISNPDKPSKGGRVYTAEEVASLFDAMSEDMRDLYALCYTSFMRLREALFLSWDRVDLKTGKIVLRKEDVKTGSKTGRGREFIASMDALDRLRSRFSRMRNLESPYVFPARGQVDKQYRIDKPQFDIKTAWVRVKRDAGIVGRARWHDLRHTALTKALIEKRKDPIAVSEYAGVSLQTIQRVYLHSTAEKTRDIASAIALGE